mgnify:CR=1 FL=1
MLFVYLQNWAIPTKTKESEEVVRRLMMIFQDFGIPEIVHSDNGREFVSKIMDLVCKALKVSIRNGAPY